MYSRPWLAVAVYVRAPAAEAPMHTDMAANSGSTLRNSHGASAPVFTSADRPSTMCVWGEIGYAPITSGRHSATVSATAREPSICLSMPLSLSGGGGHATRRIPRASRVVFRSGADARVRRVRGCDVALAHLAG